MRQSTKTVAVVTGGWLLVNGMVALVLLSSQGTFWTASHNTNFANVVYPMLAIVFVSGVTVLLAVHAYVRILLADALEEG